jgi:hypothetical protein
VKRRDFITRPIAGIERTDIDAIIPIINPSRLVVLTISFALAPITLGLDMAGMVY